MLHGIFTNSGPKHHRNVGTDGTDTMEPMGMLYTTCFGLRLTALQASPRRGVSRGAVGAHRGRGRAAEDGLGNAGENLPLELPVGKNHEISDVCTCKYITIIYMIFIHIHLCVYVCVYLYLYIYIIYIYINDDIR